MPTPSALFLKPFAVIWVPSVYSVNRVYLTAELKKLCAQNVTSSAETALPTVDVRLEHIDEERVSPSLNLFSSAIHDGLWDRPNHPDYVPHGPMDTNHRHTQNLVQTFDTSMQG